MLGLQGITYMHPNRDVLFENLSLNIGISKKIALIGNNGTGKSTLLRIISGDLEPVQGAVRLDGISYYVPQHFGQYDEFTVSQAIGVEGKLRALKSIIDGNLSDENIAILDEDWTIEDRAQVALARWQMDGLALDRKLKTLSGGQKTKVFLVGIDVQSPDIILLDEPTNHLDASARDLLYRFVQSDPRTFIVVSHDRALLNRLDFVCELSQDGIRSYGGNYDFYREQKLLEKNALYQDLQSKEKEVRKAKVVSRETMERQQKLDARGKSKQENAGVPTIMMNTLRNSAEKTGSKLKNAHSEKIGSLSEELDDLRKKIPDTDQMKLGFDESDLYTGKILFKATAVNFIYNVHTLWPKDLSFEIVSGDRLALVGSNGSGKTTLINVILGEKEASCGEVFRADFSAVYIDQDYSLINNSLNVFQQAETFNHTHLQEHEIKIRLNRFLFEKNDWEKSCATLSGGEKMRLSLCCMTIAKKAPDMIILDEPTNNLDIQNLEILTAAIKNYCGTLLVVSHDRLFLDEIGVQIRIDVNTGAVL